MKTYTIYHIPGIKIGCSHRVENRIKEQGFDSYEILETHTDIEEASRREIELQRQYGYPTDNQGSSYSNMIEIAERSKQSYEIELRRENMRKANAIYFQTRSNDEIQERSRKGSRTQLSNGTHNMQKTIKCPHCEKESNIAIMKRWHFDNCKKKGLL